MNLYQKIDQYKKLLDNVRPMSDESLMQMKEYYRIGLTYTTNALEGNTLTESETKVLLEDGLTAGGKPLRDCFEALGHSQAFDFMFSLLKAPITESHIRNLHYLFYNNIDSQFAGVYRDRDVIITGSKHPVTSYEKISSEMKQFILWFNENENNLHPVKFAALTHKKFIFIHPFIDGNGRTARLLMNLALLRKGYEIAIIPPILRNEYIASLEKAHTNDEAFIEFIAERVLETQKDMCRMLHIETNIHLNQEDTLEI